MSKQLIPLSIAAPGFLGLNTQQAGSILPVGWATRLTNAVFDDVGRIGSRKGTTRLHSSAQAGTPTNRSLFEYVEQNGTTVTIFAGGNKIWKEALGTVTDITGTITTPTADNWQFANFNNMCVGYQASHEPIVMETQASTFIDATDLGGTDTKVMQNGNIGFSGFGRTWTVVGNTLYYSDLLIHSYDGGSSGNLDLGKFWPNGMDEAVAIDEFAGLLVVFGKKSIIIYENPDDVGNMSILEGISNMGAMGRDTVQAVGKDLVFLSTTGLRSLSRSVQKEEMPLTDLSSHVRGDLVSAALDEVPAYMTSVYNSVDGFVLYSFPTVGKSFYFDLKFPNEDGSWKATTWDLAPTALMFSRDNVMHMAVTDGYVSQYISSKDDNTIGTTDGASYLFDYEGVWNDLSQDQPEVAPLLKIPKTVSVLANSGASGGATFKWAFDYSSAMSTLPLTFTPSDFDRYDGVSTYNTTYTYSATQGEFERIRGSMSQSGQVIKTGLTILIDGEAFALQRIDILVKLGRQAI